MRRLATAFAILVAFVAGFFPQAALAHAHDHGETKVFSNVTVDPDETIDGDLNVIFGDAIVKGHVTGDVNVVGGSCTIDEGAQVDGTTHCVWNDTLRAFAPAIINHSAMNAFADQDRKLFVKLASSAVVLLMFLLFPVRMRLALDRVERHPGVAAMTGVIALVVSVPLFFILLVSLIGIPLIPLEVAAMFAGVWLGTGAIALLVGRRLCELVMPKTTPSPLAALLLGLVVVSAAEIIPFIGWFVTALVWLAGLGCAILAFLGTAPNGGITLGRATIGGPPMKTPV
jgi:hypothetical protein